MMQPVIIPTSSWCQMSADLIHTHHRFGWNNMIIRASLCSQVVKSKTNKKSVILQHCVKNRFKIHLDKSFLAIIVVIILQCLQVNSVTCAEWAGNTVAECVHGKWHLSFLPSIIFTLPQYSTESVPSHSRSSLISAGGADIAVKVILLVCSNVLFIFPASKPHHTQYFNFNMNLGWMSGHKLNKILPIKLKRGNQVAGNTRPGVNVSPAAPALVCFGFWPMKGFCLFCSQSREKYPSCRARFQHVLRLVSLSSSLFLF